MNVSLCGFIESAYTAVLKAQYLFTKGKLIIEILIDCGHNLYDLMGGLQGRLQKIYMRKMIKVSEW